MGRISLGCQFFFIDIVERFAVYTFISGVPCNTVKCKCNSKVSVMCKLLFPRLVTFSTSLTFMVLRLSKSLRQWAA